MPDPRPPRATPPGSLPPAYDALVVPARARPALWRLALGVMLIGAVWVGSLVALDEVVWAALGEGGYAIWREGLEEAAHPLGTLLLFATFLPLILAVALAARLLHGRGLGSLVGPARTAARDFELVALAAGVPLVALTALAVALDGARPGLAPGTWLVALGPALALLAVQTGAEELAFRGYLQGQLAARFRARWVWLWVPALLFGALHWDPTIPARNAWVIVASTAVFGLIAADLTVRTGTLGAAWGLHMANNVAAVLVLGTPGSVTGLALMLSPQGLAVPFEAVDVGAQALALWLMWRAARWALARGG